MGRILAWIRRDFERGRLRREWGLERERLRCVRCRHDLSGLTIDLCPECGAPMRLREFVWTDGRWHLAWLLGWALVWIAFVVASHVAGGAALDRAQAVIRSTSSMAQAAPFFQIGAGLRLAAKALQGFSLLLPALAAYGTSSVRHGCIRVAVVAAVALALPLFIDDLVWFYSGGAVSLLP